MQCRQCKNDVDLNKWKFCPHCGGGLRDERFFNFFRKIFSSKRNIIWMVILELFFLGVGVSLIFIYQNELAQKNKRIMELAQKSQEIKIEWKSKEKIMPLVYVGDNKKMIELRVMSPIYGKIKTELEIPGIINKETQIIEVKPESKIYYLNPDISEEGYRNLSDSHKLQLSLKISQISDDNKERIIVDDKREIFFFARNDIIWSDEGVNNANYVVRLADKDQDIIKELVRKAADHMTKLGGKSNAMVGFLGEEKEQQLQMEAIFTAIKDDYQVRYIASPFSYDAVGVQRIKTPKEVLETKSGLCIELSLLMATALESIGLNSIIIVTHSHAWVGIEVGPMSNNFIFLETTALDKNSNEAVNIGKNNWESIKNNADYKILKLNELRAGGINPIKF